MLYDPVQAIFDGVTSGLARAFLAVCAFILAYYSYSASQGNFESSVLTLFPLAAFGVIFAWGTKGIFFLVGLACLISFLVVARIFLDSVQPKLLFMALYAIGFVYFIPLMWLPGFVMWKVLVLAGGLLVGYFLLAFVAPWLVQLGLAWQARREEERSSPS